ncbi:uncharacterized protein [Henckelia pumila]|uniref:uncharacterized protein n=1 Tax=Henckelia pumila TaxID=405737 RepID=UPI003C6E1246
MTAGQVSNNGPKPLQRNLSRRVSFNEATLARSQEPPKPPAEPEFIDTEAQVVSRPPYSACCNSCCAWTSLVLAVLLLLSILVGGVYFAFLQSNLPQVRLHRLDVYYLEVNNTDTDTFLTSDLEVRLNFTNDNSKIKLSYSRMTASLTAEGVDLGTVTVPAITQEPSSSADVRARTWMRKTSAEEAVAEDLRDNSLKHLMVIDVVLKGHIDFLVNGNKMNGFPIKVSCRSIDQSEIDNGHAPKCGVQMTPL